MNKLQLPINLEKGGRNHQKSKKKNQSTRRLNGNPKGKRDGDVLREIDLHIWVPNDIVRIQWRPPKKPKKKKKKNTTKHNPKKKRKHKPKKKKKKKKKTPPI